MTVITGGPLLDSAGEPTNGRLFLEQTARFETATGFVTQARYVARVVNGQILKADSDDPLTIPPTPDTQALRIYEELGGMKLLTRTVLVPDEATVTYAQLQDVAPPAESGSFVVPDWVAGMLAAKDDAVQSASLAASAEASAVNAAAAAESARAAAVVAQAAAEAVPAQVDAAMAAVGADPTSEFAIQQSATFAWGVTPESKGAALAHDGAVDDTAFIQAAINAAAVFGARVNLRRLYRVPNGLTVSSPVSIVGVGGMWLGDGSATPSASSGLLVSSATAVGLDVTATGVILQDFAVINDRALASAPTAGCGINFNGADHFKMRGVMVYGFYDLVRVTDCWFWEIMSSHFYDPVRYGLLQTVTKNAWVDHNDAGIVNCIFSMIRRTTNAAAAWRHEAGAGVRWIANKIVGQGQPPETACGTWDIGIDIQMRDGLSSGGEFEISNGGTSNCLTACIRIGMKGPLNTASVSRITITGHVFQGFGGANTCIGIIAGGAATQNTTVRNIHITGNHFAALGGGGMWFYSCTGVTIGVNSWQNVTGFLVRLSGGTDTTGNDTRAVSMATQNLSEWQGGVPDNVDILREDRNLNDSNGHNNGTLARRYTRHVNLTVAATWVTLYSFRPVTTQGTLRAAGSLKLEMACADSGAEVFMLRRERGYYATGTGGTVYTPTIGTDTSLSGSGTPRVSVQFDATTKPGWVLVQARLDSPGTWVTGEATLEISGKCSVYAIGLSPLAV